MVSYLLNMLEMVGYDEREERRGVVMGGAERRN
jgi:hypothetical protein